MASFNICETVGGNRALASTPDAMSFLVCENVAHKISAFDTKTGKPSWSLDGNFEAATISSNGLIYALTSAGTIYGDKVLVINAAGKVLYEAKLGGFDLALDSERHVLWLVGKKLIKCDLDLNLLLELDYIGWCAVSVDVGPDHSAWVAEREHPNVANSTNRLLKISPNGRIQKSVGLNWSPFCLRVDPIDGSVWATGVEVHSSATQRMLEFTEKGTGTLPLSKSTRASLTKPNVLRKTHHYDASGTLLKEINAGGLSIALDPADRSLWIAGKENVYHYSSTGDRIARFGGVSGQQKYIVVIPEDGQRR